jgi:hypothetical protein
MNAEISGGVKGLVAQLDAQDFARLQGPRRDETGRTSIRPDVFDAAAHQAFDE